MSPQDVIPGHEAVPAMAAVIIGPLQPDRPDQAGDGLGPVADEPGRSWQWGAALLPRYPPFFPLVQSGLEGRDSDLVDAVSDLELGLSQELAIGLGGQEFGEGAEVGCDGLLQGLEDARPTRLARGSKAMYTWRPSVNK